MTMTQAAFFTSSLFLSSIALGAEAPGIDLAANPHRFVAGEVVRIEGSGAHIQVRAGITPDVRVSGSLRRALDRVIVKRTQEGLTIRLVPLARGQTVYGRLVVEVPAEAAVSVLSLSGAVDVEGLRGDLDVNTLGGAVRAWDLAEQAVAVRTFSGSVDIAAQTLESLQVDTVSGSILYTGRLRAGARCELSSSTGEVEVIDEPRLAGAGIIDAQLGRIAAR
ncbi:MAG: hypothetical protein AAFZ18_19825 [Myxococcota bacterium]